MMFWSLDQVIGDIWIHVCPFVRPFVRYAVSRKPFFTFFWNFQLVPMFQALFRKILVLPILAKNCPKLVILAQDAKKWRFSHFFCNPFIRIWSFFLLSLVFGVGKKCCFRIFWEYSKIALFGQICGIFA